MSEAEAAEAPTMKESPGLEEAREALGTNTIRATVEVALKEATRTRRVEEFWNSFGTWEIDLTREELLRLREEP